MKGILSIINLNDRKNTTKEDWIGSTKYAVRILVPLLAVHLYELGSRCHSCIDCRDTNRAKFNWCPGRKLWITRISGTWHWFIFVQLGNRKNFLQNNDRICLCWQRCRTTSFRHTGELYFSKCSTISKWIVLNWHICILAFVHRYSWGQRCAIMDELYASSTSFGSHARLRLNSYMPLERFDMEKLIPNIIRYLDGLCIISFHHADGFHRVRQILQEENTWVRD